MITELFILSGVLFWVLFGVFSLIWLTCVENEKGGASIVFALIFLGGWFLFGDLGALVTENWLRLVYYPLGYAACGIIYSVIKWYCLVAELRADYKKRLAQFKVDNELPLDGLLPIDARNKWCDTVMYDFRRTGMHYNKETGKVSPPTFRAHDDQLILWSVFWPWSLLWLLIREPIVRTIRWLSTLYERMATAMFKDID